MRITILKPCRDDSRLDPDEWEAAVQDALQDIENDLAMLDQQRAAAEALPEPQRKGALFEWQIAEAQYAEGMYAAAENGFIRIDEDDAA